MATSITKIKFAAIGTFGLAVSIFAAGALSSLQGVSNGYSAALLAAPTQNYHVSTTSFTTAPTASGGSTQTSNATSNWAGYVSTGGTYTSISGSWNVPTVTDDTGSMAADATWIGIGGKSSDDLIQIGTQNMVQDGQVSTGSFYERLPGSSVDIPTVNVSAGDAITASVKEISSGVWTISIADTSNGESFTNTVSYDSSESSAEWIQEAPSTTGGIIPLDQFDSVTFTNGFTTKDGTSMSIAGSNASAVTMDNDTSEALTDVSDITNDGASFTVSRTSADSSSAYGQYFVVPGGNGWSSQVPNPSGRVHGWGRDRFRYF